MNIFMNVASMVLRLALAAVFGWAGSMKVLDPQALVMSIDNFKLLPDHLTPFMGFLMPWVEVLCALLLFIGWRARASALLLWVVLLTFIGAIISVIFRDMQIECGCFGEYSLMCNSNVVGWCNVLQNCLLAAACVVVLFWGPGYLSVDEPKGRPRGPGGGDDLDDL